MAKDIVIVGAGGLGREVHWLLKRINEAAKAKVWDILGYYDDGKPTGTLVESLSILGTTDDLARETKHLAVAFAVGSSRTRRTLVDKIKDNEFLEFPNLFAPTSVCSKDLVLGQGNIFTDGVIVTINVRMGDFNFINLDCTIGHDVVLESYCTLHPGVHLSGNTLLKNAAEIGTGSTIIQGVTVGEGVIAGASTAIIKDVESNKLVVGVPAVVKKELC